MLTQKYKPMQVESFVGLEKPRKIIANWLENPQPVAFLFVGDSGTGKTSMAEAIANSLKAQPSEVTQIPSAKCDQKAVDQIYRDTAFFPWGPWRVYIVNEADRMTDGAQTAFLSLLDTIPAQTVIIFTCNDTKGLEPRFLSRCVVLQFSNYGLNGSGTEFLRKVWQAESASKRQATLLEPDFTRMLKDSRNNLRDALNKVELALLGA